MYDPTQQKIASLTPKVAKAALALVMAARAEGVPLMVISGRRSKAENIAAGGAKKSRHLSGNAFDLQIAGYTRDQVPYRVWQIIGEVAERHFGLRWGGRFNDPNHFDHG